MIDTIGELLELLSTSRLLPDEELRQLRRATVDQPPPPNPADVVQKLVTRRRLTPYQGEELLAGRIRQLRLGNYVLLDVLGKGGMGTVYRARHERMNREVAIKTLPPDAVASESAARRFHREVEVAARLQHPRIVTAFDADEADGVSFLVMEYVRGESLAEHVRRQGPVPVPRAVDYLVQAAEGLAYAHREGVIHRDIKPANLLLDTGGRVKILDMGLARSHAEPGSHTAAATQDYLTQTGMVIGTVDYLAPEQARSIKTADQRADIYSLGCTLHFLLTGKPLYEGKSLMEKIAAHQKAEIPSLRGANPEIPEALEGVFQRLVAKRPEDRYASMDEVIVALRPFAGDRGGPGAGGVAAEKGSEGPDTSGQTVHRHRDDTSVATPSGVSTSAVEMLSGAWRRAGNRMRAVVLTVGVLGILAAGAFLGSRLSTRQSTTQADASSAADRSDRGTVPPATDGDSKSPDSPSGEPGAGAASAVAPTPDSTSTPSGQPPPPKKPADVDRDVARRVLALGGTVVVGVGSQTRAAAREQDLPSEPFVVREIVVTSADWTDDDLTLVGMLNGLVSLVQRQCRSVTDEGLRRLQGLTGLKVFVIENAAVTNAGLAHLTGNRELNTLAFRDLRVDDGAIDVIKQFPALVDLYVITPNFTGSRLSELSALARIDRLTIPGTVMESQSASILAGCPKLVRLTLGSPDDEAVREAAKLPGVTEMDLSAFRGTPAGLSMLATLPKLTVLRLFGGSLADEHAEALGALTRLRALQFTDQSFQPATLARIRQALPACRLIHDGTALDGPNRSAAEWVLGRGGKVTIQVAGGSLREVSQSNQLPTTTFRVIKVDLAGVADLKDAELGQLAELTRLESLNLSKTAITDAALAHCEHLWELRELHLSETAIGDAGLASVSRVTSLRWLNLAKTQVTDAGLAHLKPLIYLDYLNLGLVKVSDAGLAQITGAPKLRELWINRTRITDGATDTLKTFKSLELAHLGVDGFTGARLDELAALPKLSRLILGGSSISPDRIRGLAAISTLSYLQVDAVTNAHLAEMGRLPQVAEMYIGYTTPTGKGLAALAQCEPLRNLTVKSIKLVEEHIRALAGLKQLKSLHLADTGIDAAGVQRLARALPECRITVAPPLAETAAATAPAPAPPAETAPNPVDVDRAVARRVLSLGGTVTIVANSQSRAVSREADLPSGPFAVREIAVSSSDWTDEDLTLVGKLTELRTLRQWSCPSLTDAGLARLKNLSGLELFAIGDASVTAAGLGNLTGNKGMRHFHFANIIVDDGVVDILKQFPNLYGLHAKAANFTGARLGELSELTGITYLAVPGGVMATQSTAIVTGCPNLTLIQLDSPNDEALLQMAGLKKVTGLTLACWGKPEITVQGLSALAAIPNLAELSIRGVPAVTDAGAEALCSLTRLRRLEFENQAIQTATLAKIRQALPACDLIYDGTALDVPNRSAAEWVLERGGKVTIQVARGPARDVAQASELPATAFRVIKVDLAGVADLQDAELEKLSRLTRLQSLNLARTTITDAAMAHCQHLWELSWIELQDTAIGDEGLAVLSRVSSLRALNLQKTRITDAGLAHLKSLAGLNSLNLGHTQVTDAGLAQLAGATKLRGLFLAETQITDASMDTIKTLLDIDELYLSVKGFSGSRLEELAALPKLSRLWLGAYNGYVPAAHLSKMAGFPALRFLGIGGASDAHLVEIGRLGQIDSLFLGDLNQAATGSGLAALESLDKLRSLKVNRTKLSPEYLNVLARLTRLEQLELKDTDIDAAGVQRLTQALPKCKILVTPPLADVGSPTPSTPPAKD